MTDYKQLCADLLRELDHASAWDYQQALKDQARAALAEPEPSVPTDAETEPVIKPIQPPGRIGMTWQQTIQGLRDVLADESKDAVQMVWQRTRICDAVDLMEANRAALAEPEPLLEHLMPQPVPVSERLPVPGDCDEKGRCWWWYPEVPGKTYGYWAHEDDAVPERALNEQPTHWLPADALPQPS